MPFETTFLGPAVLVWVFCSYFAYRVVANTALEHRDWSDRTLPRRIVWVLLGPVTLLSLLIVIGCMVTYDLFEAMKEHLKRFRERRKNRILTRRQRNAKERRERFFTTVT